MGLRLQGRTGEIWRDADRGRHVGRELEVQHFLNKDREDRVERFFVRALRIGRRGGARPETTLVEVVSLTGDLMHALNRVQSRQIKRNREQFDFHSGLGNRLQRGQVGGQTVGMARQFRARADLPLRRCCARHPDVLPCRACFG